MNKLQDLESAISRYVEPGDSVFIGGFGHSIPFALCREIIRQEINRLTVVKSGADIVVDEMIAAGVVQRLIIGYIGNPGIGLAHQYIQARQAGTIEVEEWTNFAMILRLHAAVLGVPFLPARILAGGDIPTALAERVAVVQCPFTGESLSALPALRPTVAVVHAQRASVKGDVQMWGVLGDSLTGAQAAERIIVSVEEVVDDAEIQRMPDRTRLAASQVSAVCHLPGGARPSYVDGYYTRDEAAYADYAQLRRAPERLREHLDQIRSGLL